MRYDSFRHHRQSIRMKGYDYASEGAYFVTICTQNREYLLIPEVVKTMVQKTWEDLSLSFPQILLDEFIIMPNHIHGIIWISVGATPRGRPNDQTDILTPQGWGQARGPAPTLPDVVYWFKSMTTTRYRQGVYQNRWVPFQKRLWQRNYYERIIRNDEELNSIRQYIQDNPKNWNQDPENLRSM